MTFIESIQTCFSKYANFSGRASRSEMWWFFLFQITVLIAAAIIDQTVYVVSALALFLPAMSVQIRRMHDIGKSGWYLLVSMIPLIGLIVIYWLCKEGEQSANEYGPAPGAPGTQA